MSGVFLKNFPAPEINLDEIKRYMGCPKSDNSVSEIICNALKEAEGIFTYKAIYTVVDIKAEGKTVDFGSFKVDSDSLSKNLKDCDRAIIFVCTVGVGIDRLIRKYAEVSPLKALTFQAIGSERAEALAHSFSSQMKEEFKETLPRFSAGYGDLPLEVQKDIFSLLDCTKHIGVTLNGSLIMSPTKSVSAFIGIKRGVKDVP